MYVRDRRCKLYPKPRRGPTTSNCVLRALGVMYVRD
jgi:hypothetical protein